jgi:hypothetical protein
VKALPQCRGASRPSARLIRRPRRLGAWLLLWSAVVFLACGGGSDGNGGQGTGRPPGSPDCTGFNMAVCAPNPKLPGCSACFLSFQADGGRSSACIYLCRPGSDDCPAGQTCIPLGGALDSRGCHDYLGDASSTSELGMCR